MEKKLIACKYFVLAAATMVVLALALTALARPAFADEGSSAAAASGSASAATESAAAEPASAGAASSASETGKPVDIDPLLGGLPLTGDDYVWFGRELKLSNTEIGNDLIAAGQVVNVKNVKAEGDYRVAAQDISIKDSTAGENITVAAETVSIKDTTAKAVAAAGNTAFFSGTCDSLVMYAQTVYIDGTVNGDVVVGANTVEIGTNAHIKGTLRVEAASEPVMQRGAEVADVEFKQVENGGAYSSAEIESTLTKLSSVIIVTLTILTILGTLVVAVLAEWLFRRQTAGAAEMIRTRTGATIGTGIIAAIVAPIAVILLICLGVTLPVAGGVAFALFAMTAVAGGFMGASLFKLAFKNLGRFKCALAGGAIVGVASVIPFLGSIVSAAAFMYLLGYVLQSIYLGMREPVQQLPNELAE